MCDQAGVSLCPECRNELPAPAAECCPSCALPSPGALVCGQCLKSPPAFESCRASLRYGYPLDSVIHAFKYRRNLWLIKPLAQLMLDSLPTNPDVDALLAMPLDPQRLRERGFNQAHELGRYLAKVYRLPLITAQVDREVRVKHQTNLTLEQRAKHIKGVFRVKGPLPARIALIDDVMTSGASLRELALTLKKAGVEHIETWVLARTYPPGE